MSSTKEAKYMKCIRHVRGDSLMRRDSDEVTKMHQGAYFELFVYGTSMDALNRLVTESRVRSGAPKYFCDQKQLNF
jgi:hypothetical protein